MKRYSRLQPLSGNFPPIGCDFAIWQSRSIRVDFPELTSPIRTQEREGVSHIIVSNMRSEGGGGEKVEWIER